MQPELLSQHSVLRSPTEIAVKLADRVELDRTSRIGNKRIACRRVSEVWLPERIGPMT